MFVKINWARALFCLLFTLHLTAAYRINVHQQRDEQTSSLTTAEEGAKPSQTQDISSTWTGSYESSATETDAPQTTASETHNEVTTDIPTSTTSSQLSVTTNGTLSNDMFQNEGELPLPPVITPGWGVAGVIMLVTGTAYALIGVRKQTVHVFISAAYSIALGVTILIVYLIDPPISNAVQGAYVVAAVVSGCLVGVGAIFFRELAEFMGCALGGFCVSMWFLTLAPGGLITPLGPKIVFICILTAAGGALYLSHYTRDWVLLAMISFAGATVAVLGIDCFSCAGLKEFWAYVWNVNKDLFPLGVDTYPVTKGIRVETAAIIIIFLVGVASQVKLWKVVREKRAHRADAQEQARRNLDAEEANVGRQVEEATARDRRIWERQYGGAEPEAPSVPDNTSEKNIHDSESDLNKPVSEVQVYELADMTENHQVRRQADPMEKDDDGKITVRVAVDDAPEVSPFGHNGTSEARTPSIRNSQGLSISTEKRQSTKDRASTSTEAPRVVPLPFTVPQDQGDEKENDLKSDRSSVATFADDERNLDVEPRRQSLAHRLSVGSSKLLRGLSQRSKSTRRESQHLAGESSEELVVASKADREDDESSLVATIDRDSMDSADRSAFENDDAQDIEINAQLSRNGSQKAQSESGQDNKQQQQLSADTVSETLTNTQNAVETARSRSEDPSSESQNTHVDKSKSATSRLSARASLTKDHLPMNLSRVALSYRTNEWAKHLGYADTPEPENIVLPEEPKAAKRDSTKERAAPVNVEELQQGVADGTPPPVIVRCESRASSASLNHAMLKRDSRQSLKVPTGSPSLDKNAQQQLSPAMNVGPMPRSPSAMTMRRNSPQFDPIMEERSHIGPGNGFMGDTLRPRASVPTNVPFHSPQTLLGQRETFLRNKAQGTLPTDALPEAHSSAQLASSDAGSLYNYPMYAAAMASDPDDLPLSQRKQLMHRQNSLSALSGGSPPIPHMSSFPDMHSTTPFNSHQPQRGSNLPSQAAREAQLATFRSSVQRDLRAGGSMVSGAGRETPFSSTHNILSGREADVQRSIDAQRHMLLNQKDQEAQRKEVSRMEKEYTDRVFDERMRSGELVGAHREVMRRMQMNARK